MSPVLRPYQQRLLEQLAAATDKRILIVCPTGGGKTVIAAALMASGSRRALIVAHRREIVGQTAAKLATFGVHHGVIQAGDEDKLRPMAPVQVVSIQTLYARAIRSATMPMPLADHESGLGQDRQEVVAKPISPAEKRRAESGGRP